ncbi:putative iron-regulated membrane protein [Opitutaceae bacterium TAV1]|nr:putative iron-regulated membrane protein [Opitutaceae bacterium TAV1]
MNLRKTVFWLHLAAGLTAGMVIAIMSFTGAALAFENEIVAWAERDARRIGPPPAAPDGAAPARLSLDDLVARVRADQEIEARPTAVTVSAGPADAVTLAFGRDATWYANPYTGVARQPASTRVHDFMHLMEDWHRRLAMSGDNRATGRAITGACNAAFFVLAVTGLYLWWPRRWTWRALRPSVRFMKLRGRARDWNWHNVVGFWSLPVLIVLTATGMVISYRWASNLVWRVAGEEPPAQGAGPGGAAASGSDLKIDRPEGARRIGYAGAFEHIAAAIPDWSQITLREGLGGRRGAPPPAAATGDSSAPAEAAGQRPAAESLAGNATGRGERSGGERAARGERGERGQGAERRSGQGEQRAGGGGRAPQPYSATVRQDAVWPPFASTQLVLNPWTGETLSRSGYADQTPGRKLRGWMRQLHTGAALGWPGQLLAGLASLGGVVLVYTGFALSWRRFFQRRKIAAPVVSPAAEPARQRP